MRLILYVLLLCLTAWASYFVYVNPGDVEILYGDWIVNMPIWVPVLGGVALLVLLVLGFTVLSGVGSALGKFKDWFTGTGQKALEKNINQAWKALAEGDWSKAETKLLKAARNTDYPLHYYLAAAKAAQEQGAVERRDNYLHLALRTTPNSKVAVGVTQAELQLRHGQYEYCVATIQDVHRDAPNNKLVLRLAAQVYSALDEWEEIIKLIPSLKKFAVLNKEELVGLEVDAYEHLLRKEAKSSGKQALIAAWDTLPRDLRMQTDLIQVYAQLLLGLGGEVEAELVVRNALKKQWENGLVRIYGLILTPDVAKQIVTAEAWHKVHNNDATLLLTLARLCIANKLWGKARNYLESSIALETNPEAYAELGRLLGFLGEENKALECYRKGLLEFTPVLEIESSNGVNGKK